MKVIIMRGLPRSGKTTLVERLVPALQAKGLRTITINLDAIRLEMYGVSFLPQGEQDVWTEARGRLEVILRNDLYHVVIIDGSNNSDADVGFWHHVARRVVPHTHVMVLEVTTDRDTCLSRTCDRALQHAIRQRASLPHTKLWPSHIRVKDNRVPATVEFVASWI